MKITIHHTRENIIQLNKIEPSLAGPKRPQDKILLRNVPKELIKRQHPKKKKITKLR